MLEKLFGQGNNKKETYIIAGLGNPGTEYEHTRHNAGFDTMERLAERWQVRTWKKTMKGLVAEVNLGEKWVVLVKPQTYMNLSGECLQAVLKWYHCPMERLAVIYDDIDLPLGKIRVRKSGSAGTHNGMRSIVSCLGGQDFPRIRVGTGAKPEGWDLANWVLSRYAAEDRETMDKTFDKAAAAAVAWIENGIEKAMQEANRG